MKPPSAETRNEARLNVEHLRNAVEMKMEAAVLGILNTMVGLIAGNSNEMLTKRSKSTLQEINSCL